VSGDFDDLVYQHSRFEHSLGVMELATQAVTYLLKKYKSEIQSNLKKAVCFWSDLQEEGKNISVVQESLIPWCQEQYDQIASKVVV